MAICSIRYEYKQFVYTQLSLVTDTKDRFSNFPINPADTYTEKCCEAVLIFTAHLKLSNNLEVKIH